MSTSQNKVAAGRPGKKKQDPRKRTEEFIQWDVTEGLFTKFFHRFFVRRMATANNNRPYPWFIGGIHRLARTLDVGFTWELIALFAAPVILLAGYFHRILGVPAHLGGYVVLLLGCYVGYFFVLLVFLDRRLDLMDKMRINMMRLDRVDKRNDRVMRRRMNAKNAPEIARRNAEAVARGQQKAAEHAYESTQDPPDAAVPAPPPAAMQPALDDLLL